MDTLREKFEQLKLIHGIKRRVACSYSECREYRKLRKHGKPLPEGVKYGNGAYGEFYTVLETDLSDSERAEYVQLAMLDQLDSIRAHLVFYTFMIVLSLAVGLIWGIVLMQS